MLLEEIQGCAEDAISLASYICGNTAIETVLLSILDLREVTFMKSSILLLSLISFSIVAESIIYKRTLMLDTVIE